MPASVEDVVAGVEETVSKATGFQLPGLTLEKLLYTVILIVVGLIVIRLLLRVVDRAFRRIDVDPGIKGFVRTGLRVLLLFILALTVLAYLNVEVTSLVAVLSVVGLALSLAVQSLLSNVAGGLQMLSTKPFAVGDYIEAGGVAGTVTATGMFYTKMRTFDHKLIQVPNSQIAGEKIINYSSEPLRRVDLNVCASYDDSVQSVKAAIQQVLGEHPKTLATPEPVVRVSSYGESSIEYVVRVWCANEDYWDVYYDVLEGIKTAFDAGGISMTYNHLNVHMVQEDQGKSAD